MPSNLDITPLAPLLAKMSPSVAIPGARTMMDTKWKFSIWHEEKKLK